MAEVAETTATIRWLTNPPSGVPRLTVGSHAFPSLPLSLTGETGHPLLTSAGELMAGAIGSVFALLLAEELVREEIGARELIVEVRLDVQRTEAEGRERAVRGIGIHVTALLPDADDELVQGIAVRAMKRCAHGLGLRDDVLEIHVDASVAKP